MGWGSATLWVEQTTQTVDRAGGDDGKLGLQRLHVSWSWRGTRASLGRHQLPT